MPIGRRSPGSCLSPGLCEKELAAFLLIAGAGRQGAAPSGLRRAPSCRKTSACRIRSAPRHHAEEALPFTESPAKTQLADRAIARVRFHRAAFAALGISRVRNPGSKLRSDSRTSEILERPHRPHAKAYPPRELSAENLTLPLLPKTVADPTPTNNNCS